MIDLHSHLLPGVDDGSRSVEQSVGVLEVFKLRGVHTVAATPHLPASIAGAGFPPAFDDAWHALEPTIPAGMRVVRGAEIMLDRPLPPAVAKDRLVTLNRTKYILVEFPRVVPGEIVGRAMADIVSQGLVPVLAHPERYSSCSVEAATAWREAGAVLQVDATTLTMARSRGDRARDLVRAGLADILAADNHGDTRCIATALDWLADHDGAEQAEILLDANPRAILEDRALYEVDPLPGREGLWSRVRRLFGEAGDV